MSKSKMNDKKKTLALIALFAISAIIFLNSQVKDVKANGIGIDIPINPYIDPNNNWHWHGDIKNGTEYIYETTLVMQNKSTEEFMWGGKFYFIFNISIFNATIQWHDKPCFFSVINATELYYDNSLGKTVAYPMSPEIIGGFQYNDTFDPMEPKERIASNDMWPIPFFLPINGTHGEDITNDINDLADIINKSIFYPYFAHGMDEYGFPLMNLWNDIDTSIPSPDTIEILFTNASGYKCRLEYYLNGTLKNGEIYAEMIGGNPDYGTDSLMILNMTFNRIFDPNPVNEVEWDVKEGDIIYYGNNAGKTYEECYLNITDIENETWTDSERMFSFTVLYDGDPQISYQAVIATNYRWNAMDGKYEVDTGHVNKEYGIATDYMPYLGVETEEGNDYIIPNNTKEEDFRFYTNIWFIYGMMMFEANDYDFNLKDENNFFKVDGSILSGSKRFDVSYWYDKTTGVISLLKFKDEINPSWDCAFIKENYTLSSENHLKLNTKLLNNINITANITTIGNSAFVIGLLPISPVNETLPYGTPLVFIDWLITNKSILTYLNITIKLPASIDLDAYNIQLWVWNETVSYGWDIPYDISSIMFFDYATNSVIIVIPLIGTHIAEPMIAISYTAKGSALPPSGDDDDDGGGAEEPAAIPGFDLWILFGVIGLVSLIAVLKRKKFIKLA